MPNQRQQVRTPMKCRIKISHPSFGELLAQTRDLSDSGVYVKHPDMASLSVEILVAAASDTFWAARSAWAAAV